MNAFITRLLIGYIAFVVMFSGLQYRSQMNNNETATVFLLLTILTTVILYIGWGLPK